MSITTVHNGIEYRSRLEAKWSVFFQRAGWSFTYEPFDGNGYIPDFVLHGDIPCLVEVKPAVTRADYTAAIPKIERGLAGHWTGRVIILGVSPLPHLSGGEAGQSVFGLLADSSHDSLLDFGAGLLHDTDCGQLGFCHEFMSFAHSPCGCYNGNGDGPLRTPYIQYLWAEATNAVKWYGKSA